MNIGQGKLSDAQFVDRIWDDVQHTLSKVTAGSYTKAEALMEIHNDIDNWTPELSMIIDRETPSGGVK